jgi:hypothetical protein
MLISSKLIRLSVSLLCIGSSVAWAAPDLALEVKHASSSLGADGIKRTTDFTETVIRRGQTVWIERLVPQGAHSELEHGQAKSGAAKDHKHADLSAASRWIQNDSKGKIRFRLVSVHDKIVVDIAPAEYGNVGFDGSWLAAYHLIDPAILKKLKASEKTEEGQWYESPAADKNNRVRVLWNPEKEIPLKVISISPNGLSSRTTNVRVLSQSPAKPWESVGSFTTKDYSDFLD